MVSQNPPPRPPWFREPPRREMRPEMPRTEMPRTEMPRTESRNETRRENPDQGGGQDISHRQDPPRPAFSSSGAPIIPGGDASPSSPSSSSSGTDHAPEDPPAGRFPIRPDPIRSAQPFSDDRQASIEARMMALEHDYAQSAESWRESSLAMVRALEILESRVGVDSGQPLSGMGVGEISTEISALRADIAQLRTRIDGFLPPPPGQGFAPPGSPPGSAPGSSPGMGRSYTAPPPPSGASYGAPRPARLKRHVGRSFLSLIITLSGIVLAWYAATHLDSARSAVTQEGFSRIGGQPEISLYRPPAGQWTRLPAGDGQKLSAIDHYEKALLLYRSSRDEKDIAQAAAHFDAAASQGMASAQFWLGYLFEKGLGVEPSAEQAAKLYGQAGILGHIKAMHNLGVLYLEGRGVEYDVASASEWLLRAARYGFAESMNLLGFINEEGLLGARNVKYAYAWYNLAARLGHKGAQTHAPRIAISLSRRDRREAAALVAGFRVHEADPIVNGTMIAGKSSPGRAAHFAGKNFGKENSGKKNSGQASSSKRNNRNILFSQFSRAPHYVAPPRPDREKK